jgi:3-oxoacyl-[acyl-carrier-protein] synthase II
VITADVAVTGIGVEVPGLDQMADLLKPQPLSDARVFDPASKLGRKGLLYKDKATALALCAVQDALTRADLPVRELHASAPTGVVVSSNLGNLDTVCRVIDTLYAGSAGDLSVMDVPNASSNVIASSIAIRFGCRAVNLMLCNGATSGTDALFVAATALRTRRAARMIVVGVEPDNECVRRFVSASLGDQGGGPASLRLGEGAACVILEALAAARQRDATIHGVIDGYTYVPLGTVTREESHHRAAPAPLQPDLWLTPNQAWPTVRVFSEEMSDLGECDRARCDLSLGLGELYGALGVFQCVAACCWLEHTADADDARGLTVLATAGGSWGDGLASLTIRRPAPAPVH